MTPTKSKKKFDCIEFKEKAQARIYEDIKDLTPQQQIAYFNKRAENGPLGELWKRIRRESGKR